MQYLIEVAIVLYLHIVGMQHIVLALNLKTEVDRHQFRQYTLVGIGFYGIEFETLTFEVHIQSDGVDGS